jgi:hypothetical protein
MERRRFGAVPVSFRATRASNWLTRSKLNALQPTLFFHARDRLSLALQAGHFKLLNGLADHAAFKGLDVEVVTYHASTQDLALDHGGHCHIFMDDRPAYGPNAVHCVPSYLHGYWFFDEIGTRNNSLMRIHKFDPRPMAGDYAREIHAQLHARFVEANKSKFDQAARGATLEPGALCFFAQDFKAPKNHKHYLTVPEMITATIAAKGTRHLYIKPHPNQTVEDLEILARYHDPANGVEISQASIHDLLAVASCALTLSSAVGFEAFLHKKPVVLAGQTDFWQNAITVTDATKLAGAVDEAMHHPWPYEKFLVWYLRQMCVEDANWCLPRVLERLHRKGFLWADKEDKGWF